MDWLLFLGIVVVGGGGILLGFVISEIVWGVREERWLEKMEGLDRANYAEGVLSKSLALSPLLGLAKSLGIYFKLHPDSFRCSEKRGYHWDVNHISKEIRVSVDPKTLCVVPADLWDQRFVMAHEIGHVISPSADFDPPCYRDQDFRFLYVLETGNVSCLFLELGAEIEGRKILEQIFATNSNFPNMNDVLEARHQERIKKLKKKCSVCWEEIEKGRCPKKEELSSFFQENHKETEIQRKR